MRRTTLWPSRRWGRFSQEKEGKAIFQHRPIFSSCLPPKSVLYLLFFFGQNKANRFLISWEGKDQCLSESTEESEPKNEKAAFGITNLRRIETQRKLYFLTTIISKHLGRHETYSRWSLILLAALPASLCNFVTLPAELFLILCVCTVVRWLCPTQWVPVNQRTARNVLSEKLCLGARCEAQCQQENCLRGIVCFCAVRKRKQPNGTKAPTNQCAPFTRRIDESPKTTKVSVPCELGQKAFGPHLSHTWLPQWDYLGYQEFSCCT